jgi:hypothetical protein
MIQKEVSEKLDSLKVTLVDRSGDKTFIQSDFWNRNPSTSVHYTCPPKSVMVGMDWEFHDAPADKVRTPTQIKYICRELAP